MRISDWAKAFNANVILYDDAKPGDTVYRVVDLFTTRDGSWDPSDKPGSVPQWARNTYLKPMSHPQYNDDGGADRHLFGAVEAENGSLTPFFPIEFWTHADNSNRSIQHGKKHGWANMVMYVSSNFVPERNERGPWAWKPASVKADIVIGGGLPAKQHVSWWAVWKPELVQGVPAVDGGGPVEHADEALLKRVAILEKRVEQMAVILKQFAVQVNQL